MWMIVPNEILRPCQYLCDPVCNDVTNNLVSFAQSLSVVKALLPGLKVIQNAVVSRPPNTKNLANSLSQAVIREPVKKFLADFVR